MNTDDFIYDFDAPDSDWNFEPSRADLFRQIDAPLYTTDADGWLTFYNDAAAQLWGFRPVLGKARWCGSWRLFESDGTALPHDLSPMAMTLREGRLCRGLQIGLERPDGSRMAFMPYPTALRDDRGAVIGGCNILLKVERASLRVAFRNPLQGRPTLRAAQRADMHRCSA
ncbi:hypothetical protein [Methylorubrum aminovorans]|uniref:PAS domain-containing protein n=1 Tax=Methylorubrum aminovorans TaxID=269069 RepID=A0ABQ4UCI8_9HYPH|nr:hypothetical protein [Methylorubrum aminovorans]GJE64177.1 hypothetical protein LNAOJCKE_1377 [Methylorubrum aminovorans]